ncbi:Predicted Peptidoglycan domain-containing protein [Gemmobacter aquatilis]|uniref:Predicted Peptidoglycan domain-containing protein n=1 Tax=Gemmobacter aquatilis TaxID=933059 RepID=A0A1H8BDW0_9RHOB|nr:holin-associated N-acetylmuramidase [Gemmobacter aquatilis]SEM81002.1 Predicted Peptidoglycan domain-containing protein [Gemmobacter aquatilis]
MHSVTEIAKAIVAREGGYVNDPDDPGGATKYGVTLGTMQRLGLDLTRDGRVTSADVRRLSREQAVDIFLRDYYERPGIGRLPECLRASVFDMYVNAGANAVKILQRLLGDLGYPLTDDGVIGPLTARAAEMAVEAMPDTLADAYGIARRNYYYALADARPASRKYVLTRAGGKGGWITRAEEFISPAYHLTLAQHRARVATWG